VQALWCHIHYGGDVFVTSDDNFHSQQKRQPLAALGAAIILRPCDALNVIPGSAGLPPSKPSIGSRPASPSPWNRQSPRTQDLHGRSRCSSDPRADLPIDATHPSRHCLVSLGRL
jgi:hypothetical protein